LVVLRRQSSGHWVTCAQLVVLVSALTQGDERCETVVIFFHRLLDREEAFWTVMEWYFRASDLGFRN
jgi:hypothetical protein